MSDVTLHFHCNIAHEISYKYLFLILILLYLSDLVFILLDRPDESHDRMISEHIMRTHALSGTANSSSSSSSGSSSSGVGGVGGRGDRAGGAVGDKGGSQSGSQRSGGTGRQEEELSSHSTLSQRLRSAALDYEGQRDSTYMQDDTRTYCTLQIMWYNSSNHVVSVIKLSNFNIHA